MRLKIKLRLISLLIPILGSVSFASDMHCSLIGDDSERISCHLKSPEPKTSKLSGWFVTESRAMNNAVAGRISKWRVQCGESGDEGTVSILLTCSENEMSIVLSTACALGSTDNGSNVTLRIDDKPPVSKRFTIGRNTRALALKDHEDSIAFTNSLFGANKLNVTVKTVDNETFGATFEAAGLEGKIKPLRNKCDW